MRECSQTCLIAFFVNEVVLADELVAFFINETVSADQVLAFYQ